MRVFGEFSRRRENLTPSSATRAPARFSTSFATCADHRGGGLPTPCAPRLPEPFERLSRQRRPLRIALSERREQRCLRGLDVVERRPAPAAMDAELLVSAAAHGKAAPTARGRAAGAIASGWSDRPDP
jgi:hypothetical protein